MQGIQPKTLAQTLIEMGALLPGVEAGKTVIPQRFGFLQPWHCSPFQAVPTNT
jgi:hypothetical protein